ncbi:MAG: UDP-2,3-diacylglucosamine diphosphatase [Phycisphaera sp.]|nr:UDP-2,3-diacylglucosamine diphosphatase [Phycisphaera sp.]
MKARYRTLFISDCHLGSSGAKADELARFLKQVECDTVYLVGDIIDMWRLRQRWYWPDAHNTVMRRLLKMSHKGTTIVYVPGNHDEAARPFCGLSFGGMQMAKEAVHLTADGRRLLVTHGDQFDLVVRNSRLLALAGTVGYEMLLKINGVYNFGRRILGLPYDSLSQAIKARVKSACNFISNFEQALVAEARAGGFDGVVCGHIHKAEQRMIGVLEYLNCGDWVESCTALVEHEDGRIELLDGLAFLAERDAAKAIAENSGDDSDETDPWLQRGIAFDARILVPGDGK